MGRGRSADGLAEAVVGGHVPQSVLPMALMVLLQRPSPLVRQTSAVADYAQPRVEEGAGLAPMEVDSSGGGPPELAGPRPGHLALDRPIPGPPGTSWCVPGVLAGSPPSCKDRVLCVCSGALPSDEVVGALRFGLAGQAVRAFWRGGAAPVLLESVISPAHFQQRDLLLAKNHVALHLLEQYEQRSL